MSGTDFVALAASGTIATGLPSTTVTIQVNGDTDVESDENLVVVLTNPINAAIKLTH